MKSPRDLKSLFSAVKRDAQQDPVLTRDINRRIDQYNTFRGEWSGNLRNHLTAGILALSLVFLACSILIGMSSALPGNFQEIPGFVSLSLHQDLPPGELDLASPGIPLSSLLSGLCLGIIRLAVQIIILWLVGSLILYPVSQKTISLKEKTA